VGTRPVYLLVSLLPLFLCAAVFAADDKAKLPLPAEALIIKTEAQVRELYKSEYTKGPIQRRALAKQLLEQAANTNSDAATRFVFFREARNVAASAGDITTALRAVDELSSLFEIDPVDYKAAAILQAARAIDDAPKAVALLRAGNTLLNQLSASENFAGIARLSGPISNVAAQSRNRFLMIGFRNRFGQLKEAQIEFEKLSAAAARPPLSDPNADLAAGKLACFFKDDWQYGLGRMMNCTDAKIKDIAARDIANPTTPAAQVALANGWWDLAQKQTGYSKTQFQARARYWYKKALPALAALERPMAEKRILASVGAPADARIFGSHAYSFEPTSMTWHEAVLACELAGGHLACVNSSQENEFFLDLTNGKGGWIGASDEQEEGKWRWVDGSGLEFQSWKGGEPNNANGIEHYAKLERNGHWNDVHVGPHKNDGFICEWE
jgi:hypothetical protein